MTQLKAILGPTNTGKTHYAIDRMLGHASGMIGLPLRLLAREVYDRVVAVKGPAQCALITGEERIEPATARYFVCTVEAMPVQKPVDFLAVDEIQLAEDPDRGHVFTDRILNARGLHETLLLGADTMRPVLRDLDLNVDTDTRERFSQLSYAGPAKLTRLPKRSAIVAFSAEEVYAIAELLRRQKGGAAVVMGALSPRTRNAQVELYQAGEVDYLVATDAIGMGLNLDVEQIAFAACAKFDGRRHRTLTPAECGQIAGRAGRFREDGRFSETADCPTFSEELVRRIEDHAFDPVDQLQWRNSELDFRSIKTLMASLSRSSGHPVLRQSVDALDEWVLHRMAEAGHIGPDVRGDRLVRRLWDLARLPDFRKAGREGHGRLVLGLAETLADPDARLGDAGMAKRLESLAITAGDIAQLQQRLASIRTWTYAAHRDDWLENPENWRERTREVEDALSDALHTALTARFVDRRTTALLAGMRKEDALVSDMDDMGEVTVEGHVVGRLVGLRFEPASNARTLEGRAVRNAALQAVRPILARRLADIAREDGAAFSYDSEGVIAFRGEPVARLVRGADWLSPRVELVASEQDDADAREQARARIESWFTRELAKRLPTLQGLRLGGAAKTLEGPARGLAFRVMESGAAVDLRNDDPGHRLTREQREALKAIGVRAGRVAAHVPDAQKPAAQRLIALLHTLYDGVACPAAPEGAGSFSVTSDDVAWTDVALAANGYLRFGKRAVRADLAERLGWEIARRRKEAGKNLFDLPAELASIVSVPGEDFPDVARGFGVVPAERDEAAGTVTLWRYASRTSPEGGRSARRRKPEGMGRPAEGEAGASDAGPTAHARPRKPRRPQGQGDRSTGHGAGGQVRRRQGPSEGEPARPRKASPDRRPRVDPDSPFAALAVLLEPDAPSAKTGKSKPKRKRRGGKGHSTGGQDAAGFRYVPFE